MRAAVLGALFGTLAVAGMVGSAAGSDPVEAAQGGNRAAIVVDTGSGTSTACVTFSEESISGLEALRRSGHSPEVRAYSGEGGAVCRIDGVGCAADANCLTCAAPNYWAYYRADSGAGGYSYSSIGAGSTSVTDGDVEAWRWGSGAAPSYRSFSSVCPLEPPPPPPTTRPPSNGGGNGGPGGGSSGGPSGSSGGPAGGNPGSTGGSGDGPADEPGASTTTVASATTAPADGPDDGGQDTDTSTADDGAEEIDGEETAASTDLDDGGGGNARTWIAMAALLGGFALAGWRIRRIRGRSG
jgi:hypothetical protein